MIYVILLLTLLLSIITSLNHSSVILSPSVRSGLIRRRYAGLIILLGLILGIYFEGYKLQTPIYLLIGYNVQTWNTYIIYLIILLSTIITMFIASIFNIPYSLSQSLLTGILGISLSLGVKFPLNYVILVITSWIILPVISMILCFYVIKIIDRIYIKTGIFSMYVMLKILLIISTFYISYTFSANTLGFLYSVTTFHSLFIQLLLIITSMLGFMMLGGRIERVFGEETIGISVKSMSSSQIITAILTELVTQLGIPISLTQVIATGVLGAVLTKKLRIINRRIIVLMFIQWVIGPILSLCLSILLFSIFLA